MAVALVQNGVHSSQKSHCMHGDAGSDVRRGLHLDTMILFLRQRSNQSMKPTASYSVRTYEVRPLSDKRGVDLISDALPFDRLWHDTPENAVGYAMHSSRSHDAVIRVYDDAGNVIGLRRQTADLFVTNFLSKPYPLPTSLRCRSMFGPLLHSALFAPAGHRFDWDPPAQ